MTRATASPYHGTLALSFQEVLTAGARLRWKRQDPRDTSVFRSHCREALESGAQDACKAGYPAEDVRLAKFAVAAYLDDAVIHAADARFATWLLNPLESELFGSREADELFYQHLRQVSARPDGQLAADLLEVFLQCLQLGFLGMYGPAAGERKAVIQNSAAKIRQARSQLADLSPAWRAPAELRPSVLRPSFAGADSGPALEAVPVDEIVRMAEIKLSLLCAGGSLASVPVLLVMGEADCVKTSSILHCGLQKEVLAGDVYKDGNIASTDLANFWYAPSAVFVEAGAPMLANPARWQRLLEKLRPNPTAPRAALVCFDCAHLGRKDIADVVTRTAGQLRARLDEYARASASRVPVYVLFTRLDRIFGFHEFVRKLSHDEVARTIGATLPEFTAAGDSVATQATRLKDAYDGVSRALAVVRTEVLARESDGARAEAAFEFPREVHKAKGALIRFLSELCPAGSPGGPFLRGFYFSGARAIVIEENMPLPPSTLETEPAPTATGMFGASAPASNVSAGPRTPVHVATRRKIPQWLFLGRLFHEVLLHDALAPRKT